MPENCTEPARVCNDPCNRAPEPAPSAGRDAHGHFLKRHRIGEATRFPDGNLAALGHSLRAVHLPPELASLAADVSEFVAGCVSDEGDDPSQIPTRRRADLQYRARLHRRILQVDAMLELKGIADKHGKLRVAWLSMLATLIQAALRLDQNLGLSVTREARPVDLRAYLQTRGAEGPGAPGAPSVGHPQPPSGPSDGEGAP